MNGLGGFDLCLIIIILFCSHNVNLDLSHLNSIMSEESLNISGIADIVDEFDSKGLVNLKDTNMSYEIWEQERYENDKKK